MRSELSAPAQNHVQSGTLELKGKRVARQLLVPKLIGATTGSVAALALFFELRAHHVDSSTCAVTSVLGLTVVFWAFRVLESHVVGLLMCALLLLAGVSPSLVFSGFAISTFWLLLAALYIGFAMQKTGLAQRIGMMVSGSSNQPTLPSSPPFLSLGYYCPWRSPRSL